MILSLLCGKAWDRSNKACREVPEAVGGLTLAETTPGPHCCWEQRVAGSSYIRHSSLFRRQHQLSPQMPPAHGPAPARRVVLTAVGDPASTEMNMGVHSRRPSERDTLIRAYCAAGVSQAELAQEFGITYQRVHQIVHGRRR